jgi:hypothetical protein
MHDIVCARDADCSIKIRQNRLRVTIVRDDYQHGTNHTQKDQN